MKKRKLSIKKISIVLMIIILLVVAVVILTTKGKKKEPVVKTPGVVDNINGYELYENATNYERKLFEELKQILDEDKINYEEYAMVISKLFLTSFYTLDNKISKHDIGGNQYVFEEYRTDFNNKAQSTVYAGLENNIYGDRKQELPVVSSVVVSDVEKVSFSYGEKTDDSAYKLSLIINYNKDLGYQTDVTLILIHNNDKLEIAKME